MRTPPAAVLRCAAAVLLAALAACETPPPPVGYPEITFTHLPPIGLDVAEVEFVQDYLPPQAPPNVDHLFPVLPSAVARRWAADRIRAVGVSRRARVILVNAAVTETPLEKTTGLTGVFTTDQAARYDATVEVRIEIVGGRGEALGHARAVARRSRTVPENITLNDRDKVWFDLTEALMRDLDKELELTIRRYLAKFVR